MLDIRQGHGGLLHIAGLLGATLLGGVLPAAFVGGCGDSTVEPQDDGGTADDGGDGSTPDSGKEKVVTLHPDAPPLPGETECEVVITTGIPIGASNHLEVCTPVDYPTNPPSGGPHWGKWAAYKAYATVVPRPMYVHNLEHGSVVLSDRCEEPCPEVVDFLSEAFTDHKADPLCIQSGQIQHRLLLTPDPELDAPVALAAWGATYVATCLDRDSIDDFIAAHYAKAPENTCAQGMVIDDPDAGPLDCDTFDGGSDAGSDGG